VKCKWACRAKYASNGSVNKYKVRLVAKGFYLGVGLDYSVTFSLIVNMDSIPLVP
jgi:hypothetical protein